MKTKFILSVLFVSLLADAWGQKRIRLDNPSFEETMPIACKTPSYWIDLGKKPNTPPDIQPGFFGVTLEPQSGRTYVGLVVREDNTWEGVGQILDAPLRKDSSYSFSLWLTRSNAYRSPLMGKSGIFNFNAPTILKIWGYNNKTKEEELLAVSQPVGHSQWVRYEFVLTPTLADYDEIDLMAYYAPGFEYQNGNLLIDNCSAIELIK